MEKKFLLSLLCFMLSLPVANAQSLKSLLIHDDPVPNPSPIDDITQHQEVPDTVYCVQTKKQDGWFAPFRTISKKHAEHMPRVIRFTQRNAHGHWLKMEIINAQGEYISSPFSPYIYQRGAENTDPTANQEWSARLKGACIYEMIPDPTGMNVIQERAYDRDYNLVFSFSRTPVAPDSLGHQRYVGSYRDFYGLPAEMRDDPNYTYGTLVMITEDQWGNDSIIQFMDAKGVPKPNNNGVGMSRCIYNQAGLPIKNQSCDAQGNPIIDNWGNCGYINAYNDDGLGAYATYIDEKDQPMPMPGLRTFETGHEGIMRINYMYDEWGRFIRETYTLADGTTPGANAQGVHRIDYYPDEWGNDTLIAYYDTLGNPAACQGGYVKQHYRYNERGQKVTWWGEDFIGRPFANPWYYCRMEWEYDSLGSECAHRYYEFRDGEELLADQDYTRREGNCIYTPYKTSGQRVDSLDCQGRLLTRTYYIDSCMLDTSGWAKEVVQYEDEEQRCIQRTTYLDCNGRPSASKGVASETMVIDSALWSKGILKWDSLGNIVEAFVKHFTPHWEKWVGQSDINESGIICRAGGIGGARYYRADILWDPKEDSYTLVGRDEFNEPDYIDDDGYLYYYRKETKTGRVRYDEDNDKTSKYNVNKWLPKVPSVEVIDSEGYRLGLKDNDIILSYGDYTADPQTRWMTLSDYKTKWTVGAVLNAEREKRVVVFRINPDTKEYGLVELTLPPGTPSQLGFVTHVRYLTRRQMERIKESVEDSPLLSCDDLDHGNTYDEGHSIIAVYPELRLSERKKLRDKQMMDPSVLVGSCIPDYGLTWTANDSTLNALREIFDSRGDDKENSPEGHFFLTKNLRQTCDFSFKGNNKAGLHFIDISVNDSVYAKLCEITLRLKASMDSFNVNTLNRKTLCGLWHASETVAQSTHDEDYLGSPYTCDVELCLEKDGRFLLDYQMQVNPFCYSGYWFSDENWAYADFDVQGEYAGNWHPAGRSIVLEYTDTICQNFRLLSAYDGNGNPSVDVLFVRNCLNGLAKDKYKLLDKTLPGAMLAKFHPLLLCAKDSFVLDRTDTPNPVFHKAKASKRKRKSSKTADLSSLYNGLTGTWRFPIWNDSSMGSTIVRLKSDHALSLSSSYHYDNGDFAFDCKIQADGWWGQKGPRLTLSYPDSLIEYTIENIESHYAEESVKELVLSQKQVLRNIAFDTEVTNFNTTILSLDGDTLVIAGEGLTGILTRCEDDAQAIAYTLPRSLEHLSVSGTLNGHDYVDLGLSVKWSSCYLGAESPTDYGNYYQWGALAPKTSASDVSPVNGLDVKDIAGNASYDVARDQWGDAWRMPAQAEMVELESSCIWMWTVLDHVQGYVVIGPNGNSIFLSAAGIYTGDSPIYVGTSCSLWSSTSTEADPDEAYNLHFWKAGQHVQLYERNRGHMIRPVCP